MLRDFCVLIVEDEKDAIENLRDILSLDGYPLKLVSSCAAASRAIGEKKFDCAIIDWTLPDGGGDSLISELARVQPDTPVVVVTGIREFDTAISALRHGAHDFLTKPINPDLLRSILVRLVERQRHLAVIEEVKQKDQQRLLADERLAAMAEMVAGLAHESRNAFQRCYACLAELSLDLGEMPDSLILVEKIQTALDDVHFVLEEVRNYSKPIVLEKRHFDIRKLFEDTWMEILDVRSSPNVPSIQYNSLNYFPPTVLLDFQRLKQVARNLLENAIAACDGIGSIEVSFDLAPYPDSMIILSVDDSGKGIRKANWEKIFTPFFTTKTRGTGLGLAICQRIIEAHSGRISLQESNLGGAKFCMEIPLSPF